VSDTPSSYGAPSSLRKVSDTSKLQPMWSWIVIGICYVLVIGGFRILGGIGAAADAVRDWGRASSNGAHQMRPSS
jgi:hypothetical protein